MKKIILSVCLISLVFYGKSYGNAGFSEGYIIKNDQDTVFGYIKNQNSLKACKKCIFKETPESQNKTYYPGEIHGYRYQEGRFFLTKAVPYPNQKNKKEVFLEILVDGIASVYYLRDKYGDRYFIDKEQDGIMELSDPQRKYNFRYPQKLKTLMYDCENCDEKIDEMQLDYASLVDLAKEYHYEVCDTDSCIVYKRDFKKVDYRFVFLYGATITNYTFGNKLVTHGGMGHQMGVSIKMDNVVISNHALGVNLAMLLEFENKYDFQPFKENNNIYVDYEGVEYRLNTDDDMYQAVSELPVEMNLLVLKMPVLVDYKLDYESVTLRMGLGLTNKFVLNYNNAFELRAFERQFDKSYNFYMAGGIGKVGLEWKKLGDKKLYTNIIYEYLEAPAAMNQFLRLKEHKFSLQVGYTF